MTRIVGGFPASRMRKLVWMVALGVAVSTADRASGEAPVTVSLRDPILSSVSQACVLDPFHRAGHPECVSRFASPSNHCRYGGYYVGGGLPLRGEARCAFHEGTWGWDYAGLGILFTKKVALGWGHGRHHQGGAGAYKTDGPKLRHH